MLRFKQIQEFQFTPTAWDDWKILKYNNATWKYVHEDPANLSWSSSAWDTSYDNSTSWLTADNVQSAIDEVESRVDNAELWKVWTKLVDESAIADWYILKYSNASWKMVYSSVAEWTAATTSLDTANFNLNLSAADDTVQKAIEKLDDLVSSSNQAALSDTYTLTNVNTSRTLNADDISLDELADVVWTVVEDMKVNNLVDTIAIPDYTVSNVTETRTFDANSVSIEEIADVLWTLVNTDLNKWLKWEKWEKWDASALTPIPDYTLTSDTELRTLDADSTSVSQLADVLCTFIKDANSWLKWNKWDTWEGLTWNSESFTNLADDTNLTEMINAHNALLDSLRQRWIIT